MDLDLAGYRSSVLKDLDKAAVVTYQASGKTWFVISGTKGDEIFYQRHMLTHGAHLTEVFGHLLSRGLEIGLRSDRRAHGEVVPAGEGISKSVTRFDRDQGRGW